MAKVKNFEEFSGMRGSSWEGVITALNAGLDHIFVIEGYGDDDEKVDDVDEELTKDSLYSAGDHVFAYDLEVAKKRLGDISDREIFKVTLEKIS
jgi:hypothetical protein